jgi:hypothetical protein
MKIECTIKTPQHKDGKVHHYHTQSGYFDTETLEFNPHLGILGQWMGRDHSVQFHSIQEFNETRVDLLPKQNWIKRLFL